MSTIEKTGLFFIILGLSNIHNSYSQGLVEILISGIGLVMFMFGGKD